VEAPADGQGSRAVVGSVCRPPRLSLTADTYTHVLSDGQELDYGALVAELIS
jgi:hypothetical protein